jgi:methyl-accepting chemotaxis protein
MNFAIRKIILFPENTDFDPRIIDFEPGCINIITGTSQRGKSAVSKIIDYCLGASKCAIPVGIIRESVSWFAVEILFKGQYMLLARKSPKKLNSSTDCYLEEKSTPIVLPKIVERNMSLDLLKSRINTLLGLPDIALSPSAPENYNARPSYRDLVAFNYLPQHIVANPYTLFFRTETMAYKERLKRVFPLALGIVDNEYYVLLSEEEDLQKKIADLKKELGSVKATAEKIKLNIETYINEAKELGLIEEHFSSDNLSATIDRIRRVIEENKEKSISSFLGNQTSGAIEELIRLIGEEDKTAKEIEKLRRRLVRYQQLSGYLGQYSNELANQSERVGILGWFSKNLSNDSPCILCGNTHHNSTREVKWLQRMANSIKREALKITQEPARLDKDIESLRQKIGTLHEEMMVLRKMRAELESDSEDVEKARHSFQRINQFIGRMQQVVLHIDYADDAGEISCSLKKYNKELKSIRSKIAKYSTTKKQEEAFLIISHHTQGYAKHLALEKTDSAVRFYLDELMLGFDNTDKFDEQENRAKKKPDSDYLFEIGSGENWMGYHVAFFLSLHEKFATTQKSPVFPFLIIDQPTQVYFPSVETTSTYDQRKEFQSVTQKDSLDNHSGVSKTPENSKTEDKPRIEVIATDNSIESGSNFDVDVKKARRIFEVLSLSLKDVQEKYQIIVTEHADEDVWGGIELIHRVANWRGNGNDCYLIPTEWLPTEEDTPNESHVLPSESMVSDISSTPTESIVQADNPEKTLFDNAKDGKDSE